MLYSKIFAVSQIHTKHINTLCGQNVEFFNFKPGGTYSYHWALRRPVFTNFHIMVVSSGFNRKLYSCNNHQSTPALNHNPHYECYSTHTNTRSVCSVSIAQRLWGPPRPAPPPSYSTCTAGFLRGIMRQGIWKVTIHVKLMLKFRMCGAISRLPHQPPRYTQKLQIYVFRCPYLLSVM